VGLAQRQPEARRFYASIGEEVGDRIATWIGGEAFRGLATAVPPADGLALRTAVAADCPLLARFLWPIGRDRRVATIGRR
jgi:hypothetical protein